MNSHDYRNKLAQYVERAIKSQVEDLAKDWQSEKLCDLYQSLSDYMEVRTEPVAVTAEPVTIKDTAVAQRLEYRKKKAIVTKILDLFQSQAGTQKSKFAIKAADYGMSRDDFVTKIAKTLNNYPQKEQRFPDLQIKYVKTNDGAMFYLSRKESAKGTQIPAHYQQRLQ